MTEYTCSVCNRKFDEDEKKLTEDSVNCILHCSKDSESTNENIKIKFLEIFHEQINAGLYSIVFPKIDYSLLSCYDNLEFEDCIFHGDVKLQNVDSYINCKFYDSLTIQNKLTIDFKYIFNCVFYKELHIIDSTILEDVFSQSVYCKDTLIEIRYSIFNEVLYLKRLNETNLILNKCTFNEEINFDNIQNFKQLDIQDSKINKKTIIKNCTIEMLSLSDLILNNKIIITDAKINDLFLKDVRFKEFCDFENTIVIVVTSCIY